MFDVRETEVIEEKDPSNFPAILVPEIIKKREIIPYVRLDNSYYRLSKNWYILGPYDSESDVQNSTSKFDFLLKLCFVKPRMGLHKLQQTFSSRQLIALKAKQVCQQQALIA